MAPPFSIDDREMRLSASLGIALHPLHGRALEEVLEAAETTMFAVARSGGNDCRIAPLSTPDDAAPEVGRATA